MAARWFEGFEAMLKQEQFERHYASVSGVDDGTADGGHDASLSSLDSNDMILTSKALASPTDVWIIGTHFRITSNDGLLAAAATNPYIAWHLTGSGEQLRVEMRNANPANAKPGGLYYRLHVLRGATELAQSNEVFRADNTQQAWTYFEFKADIDTVLGSLEARWSPLFGTKGQTVTWSSSLAMVNTANQGVANADAFAISCDQSNGAYTVAFDDLYVLDGTGAANNDFIGPVRIEALDPTGDGNTTDWALAGGSASVEDALNEGQVVQSTLEDDKRITSSTVAETTLATMSSLGSIVGNIVGVRTALNVKMETTGSRTIAFRYRRPAGPAETNGDTVVVNSTTFVGVDDVREQDPNTAAAWTVADVNAVELGVRVTA